MVEEDDHTALVLRQGVAGRRTSMGKGLYKKKKVLVVAVLMAAIMAGSVYAEEPATDEYGNTIDWNEESGNEDGAGFKNGEDSTAETYSFQEQADVLKQMQEAETQAPSAQGLLTVSLGEMPEKWSENNIRLILYRGNAQAVIFLYRQSGWTASEQIPVGHYTVYHAATVDGTETFHADAGSFDITENTAVNLVLSCGEADVAAPTLSASESQEIENAKANDAMEAKKEQRKNIRNVVLAAVGVLVLLLAGFGAVIMRAKKFRDDKGADRSMLD